MNYESRGARGTIRSKFPIGTRERYATSDMLAEHLPNHILIIVKWITHGGTDGASAQRNDEARVMWPAVTCIRSLEAEDSEAEEKVHTSIAHTLLGSVRAKARQTVCAVRAAMEIEERGTGEREKRPQQSIAEQRLKLGTAGNGIHQRRRRRRRRTQRPFILQYIPRPAAT